MSARAPKMYTLGTYYNIIDKHIKLQSCLMLRLCDSAYGGKEEIVIQKCYYVKLDINNKL